MAVLTNRQLIGLEHVFAKLTETGWSIPVWLDQLTKAAGWASYDEHQTHYEINWKEHGL